MAQRPQGLDVRAWTVGDPEEMRRLAVEAKAVGIVTDDAGLLQEVVSELGGA